MRRLAAIGVVVASIVTFIGARNPDGGPELGVVYDSGRGPGDIQNLYVAAPAAPGKPGLVRFYVVTDCGAGDLEAALQSDGRIKGRGRVYDVVDDRDVVIDVRIEGRLGRENGDGTVHATRVKGPDCRDELDWTVTPERTEDDYRRFEAVIASPNPDYNPQLVANATGVFALVPATKDASHATTIARVDPESNEVDWTEQIDLVVDDAAATADALWLVDGADGAANRFDLATRTVAARIELGSAAESDQNADLPLGLVTASDGMVVVSVGDSGRVHRIDPATNAVAATLELGGPLAHLSSGPAGLYAEVVLPPTGEPNPADADRQRPLRGSEHSRLVLLDPETGGVRAQIETPPLWDLEASPDGLYTSEGTRAIVRRDPVTLAELVRGDFLAKAIGVAPPGIWLSGFDTAAVVSDSLVPRAELVDVGTRFSGGLTTGFGSVWLAERGGITRFRDGETPP